MSERTLSISGVMLTMNDIYAAGHTLTPEEAYHLNQTRAENCRNGFAAKVKEVVKEGVTPTEDQIKALQSAFATFATEYKFTMGGGRTVDPLQRECNRLAGIVVDGELAKLGKSKSAYVKTPEGKAKYDANIAKIAALDATLKKAKANLNEAAKLGASVEF